MHSLEEVCKQHKLLESGIVELKGHEDSVLCLCMNHEEGLNQKLFSGSMDNCVRIWDVNGKVLIQADSPYRNKSGPPITSQTIGPLSASVTAIAVDYTKALLLSLSRVDKSNLMRHDRLQSMTQSRSIDFASASTPNRD